MSEIDTRNIEVSPQHATMSFFSSLSIRSFASLVVIACAAATSNRVETIPADVLTFVSPTDTLLAYKASDLYNDGLPAAVIVVRHLSDERTDGDFNNNPCELIVLHQVHGVLSKVDHSNKAVDCTYNDLARGAPTMALDENLTAAPGSIVYVNQKSKGNSTFYFALSRKLSRWYLQRATAAVPEEDDVKMLSAAFPKDFARTPMAAVDPEALVEILAK
jgi:hypothetical protein